MRDLSHCESFVHMTIWLDTLGKQVNKSGVSIKIPHYYIFH